MLLQNPYFLKKSPPEDIFSLLRERKRERETQRGRNEGRKGGKHQYALLVRAPTGDGTHNLCMFPDQKLNPQPFGLWGNAPTNSASPARAKYG